MATKNTQQLGLVYRQGDVALVRVSALPEKAAPVEAQGPIVLAEGEVTGHSHTIERTPQVTEHALGDTRYIVAEVETWLRHQEHSAIKVEPAIYEVRRQREYVPGPVRERRVAD